ncbi:MAG: type II toxin-antitoxin system VapC family toxin [Anaerolineae bacterium]
MSSPICIDANLLIRTLVPGPLSDRALLLLHRWQKENAQLLAPVLLAFEVTSTLRRLVYLGELTPAEGEEAFAHFLQMDIRLSNRRGILPLAWRLAQELNRPRAYDTVYLALAQLFGCDFWTADERLYNAASEKLGFVKWIGSIRC